LRLIHAELPQHNGRPNIALDRLYALLEKVDSVLGNLQNDLAEDGTAKTDEQSGEQKTGRHFYFKMQNYSVRCIYLIN